MRVGGRRSALSHISSSNADTERESQDAASLAPTPRTRPRARRAAPAGTPRYAAGYRVSTNRAPTASAVESPAVYTYAHRSISAYPHAHKLQPRPLPHRSSTPFLTLNHARARAHSSPYARARIARRGRCHRVVAAVIRCRHRAVAAVIRRRRHSRGVRVRRRLR